MPTFRQEVKRKRAAGVDPEAAVRKQSAELPERVARLTAGYAARFAPRLTGALADSLAAVHVSGHTWGVAVGVPYWSVVEFGGAHSAASPYLRPGLEQALAEAAQELNRRGLR